MIDEYTLKNNLENIKSIYEQNFYSFYMLPLTPFHIHVKRYKNNENKVSFYGY
jgi:hypothetical protein